MRRLPALFLLAASAVCGEALAWSPEMEDRVVFEATRLMPPSLRSIIDEHVDSLREGLREAAVDEGSPAHTLLARSPGRGVDAAARAAQIASEVVSMINGHRPFADVVRKMGALAHVVCDFNNPLRVSDDDPGEYRYANDYIEYVRSNLDRYPLVFYGWDENNLRPAGVRNGPEVTAFARQSARRARQYYTGISRAYSTANREPDSRRFDVRSIPFGIGSISYSYSVTDTARIWLHLWRVANGDLSGTPYLSVAKPLATAPAPAPAPAPGERR